MSANRFNKSKALLLACSVLVPSVLCAAGPSTATVTNTNDSGAGSLRQAITDTNFGAASSITFLSGLGGQIINLLSSLPIISSNLTITAPSGGISVSYPGGTSIITMGGFGSSGAHYSLTLAGTINKFGDTINPSNA